MSELENYSRESELHFSDNLKNSLINTVYWTKFLAILSFVVLALVLLFGLFFALFASTLTSTISSTPGLSAIPAALVIIYIIVVIGLSFYPVYQLYLFSAKARLGIGASDQSQTEQAFEHLRKMYKFEGILSIVALCIYALIFLIGIGSAAFH